MKFRRALAGILAVALLSVALIGCTSGGGGNQVLRFNLGSEPTTLDAGKSTWVHEANVMLALHEGLMRVDANVQPQKALAEDYTVSPDGTVYTFKLRQGLKFSNGDPLTAHDFEWTWKRNAAPETASEYNYMLFPIKGAEAYASGEGSADDMMVKALDDLTLEVTLEAPTPYFLSLAAFPTLFPLNRNVVEGNDDWWLSPDTYAGTGPFKMQSYDPKEKLVVVKNENYWDAKSVKLAQVDFLMIAEESTSMQMLEAGQLDISDNAPVPDFPHLEKEGLLVLTPWLGTYFYKFNADMPWWNKDVTKALSLAIDREALTANVTKAGELPATAFVGPGFPDGKGGDFRATGGAFLNTKADVEAARKALADAGYPDGKGFPSITLELNSVEQNRINAEAITQMWKDNLGIDVKISVVENAVAAANNSAVNFEMHRLGWIADFIDPINLLELFVTDGGNNNTNWGNKQYDELIAKARVETDPTTRMGYLHEAEKILMAEGPIIPIYHYVGKAMQAKNVKGVIRLPIALTDLKTAYLD